MSDAEGNPLRFSADDQLMEDRIKKLEKICDDMADAWLRIEMSYGRSQLDRSMHEEFLKPMRDSVKAWRTR